ncbi:MAG: SurA N-terminal domain-containing protein [Bacteroidetes bacterium]|nr:SurA N-terminal domain-containing protein [Bacteroidota bacterium]
MAAIGKIRQHSGLLIFIIGAAIVGFLVMDATNSQSGVLKGRSDTVGKVNGEKISITDFNRKYDENVKNFESQMKGMAISEDQRNYLRTQTWNEMVNSSIFDKIYEKLGIGVTADEMGELATGENVSQYIKNDQQFKDPNTGQFDPARVRLYISQLDAPREGIEPGVVREQWLNFEKQLKKNQYQAKYDNLINKGFYVAKWMGEMMYNEQNRFVNFRYVQLPYSEVNDADLKVSDDEMKKYIESHAAKFKVDEETRKVQYVTFDIVASSSDTAKIVEELQEKRDEFANGAKVADDSVFAKIYSETPFDEAYYDKEEMNSPVKDSFFTLPVKSLVGPYVDGKYLKLAKISDRKMISDSVHVREIKISFEGINSQEAAAAKFKFIDSVLAQIDSLKQDLGLFAVTYSDDALSKMRGGDIGWVKKGAKDKMYNDLIFYHATKGRAYKVPAATENAIYIVQVVEDRPTKAGVLVTYLSKEIIPSPETERTIYGNATTFASEHQNEAKFKEAGQQLNIKSVESLKKDDFTIQGLGAARDIVKWIFGDKTTKGSVSSVFTVERKHVVALVEQIRPMGLQDLEVVRDQVKAEVIKQKKFELLSKKVTDAKAANIDDLAAKLGKAATDASHVSFSNPSINGMFEPKVTGVAINTAVGKMSSAVEGSSGVFVVQPVSVEEPAKIEDYSMYAFQLKQQLQSKTRFAQEVQKKLANVTDNRFNFF